MRKVVWTKRAKKSLDLYCDFIAKDSISSAKKVRKTIIEASKQLAQNPYLYQADEYYPNNSGNIRRFFKWQYRVVYQIKKSEIVVLEIHHTSKNPE